MYTDTLLTPNAIGKKRRLHRILGSSGKAVIVPLDDNLISSYNIGLQDLKMKIAAIEAAHPNGILCYYGTASLLSDLAIPVIINITASTVQSQHSKKTLISSVQQAVAIDASAVAEHINISSQYESKMLHNLGTVSESCNKYGMPLLAIIYPRKESDDGDENYLELKQKNVLEYTKIVSHCVRIAFELGADIIKTQYTGDPQTFSQVVNAANGRPILIAGGSLCEENKLFEIVKGATEAGAAAVSIGRNVFNRSNSAEIINTIHKIIFS